LNSDPEKVRQLVLPLGLAGWLALPTRRARAPLAARTRRTRRTLDRTTSRRVEERVLCCCVGRIAGQITCTMIVMH
jgi:hypothetical protein